MFVSRKILNQTLACVPVLFNVIILGIGWGWAAPTLVKLQHPESGDDFTITADQASWIGSINEIGRVLSPFITPFIVDNFGRRNTLALVPMLLLLFWTILFFARNFYLFCVARVIFGVANGVSDVSSAVYTTENCSASFRGIIGAVIQLVFYAGQFAEFTLATYLPYKNVVLINVVLSVGALGVQYYGVETPFFLVMKGRYDEAKRSLMWVQGGGTDAHIASEIDDIKRGVERENKKSKSIAAQLSSAVNVKAILLVLGVHLFTSATGSGAINPWASLIFAPSETFTSNEYTILFGVVQFVAVCASPFIVEKVNRRTLLVGVMVGIGFANMCVYVLLHAHNHGLEIAFYPWVLFASVSTAGSLYSLITPAIFVLRGELLPLSVRAIGGSGAIIIQSATSFSSAKIFLPITESFGMETNFFLYILMGAIGVAFIYFCLPETRGKSLEEIERSLSKESHVFKGPSDVVVHFQKGDNDKFKSNGR